MKTDIHPAYVECTVRCACGNTFDTRAPTPDIPVEVCSKCHPYFTPEQRILPPAGRVARFRPAGMDVPVDLFTLDPTPADPAARQKIDERFDPHAKALEAFEAGDWDAAFNLLHPLVQDDPAARYV